MRMIHTITVFQKIEINESTGLPHFGDRRCVGWFESYNEADYAVKSNYRDIHKNLYEYAMIETLEDGVFKQEVNRALYQWNGTEYQLIEEPEILSKCSNFGIG